MRNPDRPWRCLPWMTTRIFKCRLVRVSTSIVVWVVLIVAAVAIFLGLSGGR